MWISHRDRADDPLARSRQIRRLIEARERSSRQHKALRKTHWYDWVATFGLLLTPAIQYVGFRSAPDPRWFHYPLVTTVLLWFALTTIYPLAAPVKQPLTVGKIAFVAGAALLLIALASQPSYGIVMAYRAVTWDLLVFVSATTIASTFNYFRFRKN